MNLTLEEVEKQCDICKQVDNYHGVIMGKRAKLNLFKHFIEHVAENGRGHMQKMAQKIMEV